MEIEIKLKEIRQSKNISLKKLAVMTGISSTHLNDIENNLKTPSLSIMLRIAKVLKVDVDDLYIVLW